MASQSRFRNGDVIWHRSRHCSESHGDGFDRSELLTQILRRTWRILGFSGIIQKSFATTQQHLQCWAGAAHAITISENGNVCETYFFQKEWNLLILSSNFYRFREEPNSCTTQATRKLKMWPEQSQKNWWRILNIWTIVWLINWSRQQR